MATPALKEARELVTEHLEVLRGYAQRVLLQGQTLSESEELDRERRVSEFLAIGSCLGLTRHEMVTQVYRDMFRARRSCDCPTCRNRSAGGQ